MKKIVHFLHECGQLAKTPRSGFAFLGSCNQSVAEHSYRMCQAALMLSFLVKEPIDQKKLLLLCLFHDFPEARTGDLNYVNKRYLKVDEEKIFSDLKEKLPEGESIVSWIQEYEKGETLEAKLAKDADQIELLLQLKEASEQGNPQANMWIDNVVSRLVTEEGKSLAEEVLKTPSYEWWPKN